MQDVLTLTDKESTRALSGRGLGELSPTHVDSPKAHPTHWRTAPPLAPSLGLVACQQGGSWLKDIREKAENGEKQNYYECDICQDKI